MKTRSFLTIITIMLTACNNDHANTPHRIIADTTIAQPAKPDPLPVDTISDTIKRFIVDDYPVTDSMLGTDHEVISGNTKTIDFTWFTNKSLGQTLAFQQYTDHHRLVTYHFYNNDIPPALVKRMELNNKDGGIAGILQKNAAMKGFIAQAQETSPKFFTSDKGFRLGDEKEKALKIYGTPGKRSKEGNTEILEWDFVGDILYDGKSDLKGKPLAKDNYGHEAIMFFRNGKLMAVMLHNDIP